MMSHLFGGRRNSWAEDNAIRAEFVSETSPGGWATTPWFFVAPVLVPSQLNRDDELEGLLWSASCFGGWASFHTMKSLILAQDERWRRA